MFNGHLSVKIEPLKISHSTVRSNLETSLVVKLHPVIEYNSFGSHILLLSVADAIHVQWPSPSCLLVSIFVTFIRPFSQAVNIMYIYSELINTHVIFIQYFTTGKVYAHHIHCGFQAKRRPGQNVPSGEGKSCEATARREKLPLLLSSRNFDFSIVKEVFQHASLSVSLSLSPSLSLSLSLPTPSLAPSLSHTHSLASLPALPLSSASSRS